jgi:hypothetical protein
MPVLLQPGLRSLETPGPIVPLLEDIAIVSDALREVTTTSFRRDIASIETDFPDSYVNIPIRVYLDDPISTRADTQNEAFMNKYLK